MNEALERAPWLGGPHFGLADAGLVSFFYRLDLLRLDCLWSDRFPTIAPWLNACIARPSFGIAISAFLPAGMAALYANAGESLTPHLRDLSRTA